MLWNQTPLKWKNYSVFSQRYRLVGDKLFDMGNGPGQFKDVSKEYPELVKSRKDAYENFWDEVRPMMINEKTPFAKTKPYEKYYDKQKAATGIPNWVEPAL